MPFEDILPEINEIAADVLKHTRNDILYSQIKNEFKGLSITYHIGKLGAEFEESHREVKLQPVKNKQLTMQQTPKMS